MKMLYIDLTIPQFFGNIKLSEKITTIPIGHPEDTPWVWHQISYTRPLFWGIKVVWKLRAGRGRGSHAAVG